MLLVFSKLNINVYIRIGKGFLLYGDLGEVTFG